MDGGLRDETAIRLGEVMPKYDDDPSPEYAELIEQIERDVQTQVERARWASELVAQKQKEEERKKLPVVIPPQGTKH